MRLLIVGVVCIVSAVWLWKRVPARDEIRVDPIGELDGEWWHD